MPNLKYTKFKSGMDRGAFSLYRVERIDNKEFVFAISGTDMSALMVSYEDINFDEKSEEILKKLPKTTSAYFTWVGQSFFPCEPEEINWKV